jgi:hypothetical protein
MKTVYLFIFLLLFINFKGFSQTWDWTHPEPNGNLSWDQERDQANDIQTDTSGNVYVLGDFNDTLFLNGIFRTTGYGSYLAKYDSTGKLLWYRTFILVDGTGNINASGIAVNSKGVFVVGKYLPGVYIGGYDCKVGLGTGGASITYNLAGDIVPSVTGDDGFFIEKLNSDGSIGWLKTAKEQPCNNGLPGTDPIVTYVPTITTDKNNNIITGFAAYSIHERIALGGDSIQTRSTQDDYNGRPSIVLVKYNPAGTLQWSNFAYDINAVNSTDCNSIVTDKNGNIFVYGLVNDSCLFGSITFHTSQYLKTGTNGYGTVIAKISSAGIWQFANELDNGNITYSQQQKVVHVLATDNSNNLYVMTTPFSTLLGDTIDISKGRQYLVKMNNSGNLIWEKLFGTYGITYANNISFANSSLYITGGIQNDTYLGYPWYFSGLTVLPTSPVNSGEIEYFVSKADLNGNFLWVTSFADGNPDFSAQFQGYGLKVFNNNIYTGGNFDFNITTLGNFNNSFINPNTDSRVYNIFFGKLKDQYIRVGAVTPTQIIPGCTLTIPFTSTGLTFSATNKFTAELSDASGSFTNATAIGNVTSTGSGSITATIPASLTYGSGYRVRIRSSDTLKTGYNYYAYADTIYKLSLICPPPLAGFTATNITSTTATLNWTSVGCASGYKVQYRVKGTTVWTTANITTNTDSLNITGLTVNTIYQWHIATRCKNNGTISFSAFSPAKQFTTAASFTTKDVDASAIRSANSLQLIIEPNPTTASAMLVVNGNIKNASVTITDLVGKTIWEKNDVNSTHIDLPVEKLASGVYIVKLTNGNKTATVKLVKQ